MRQPEANSPLVAPAAAGERHVDTVTFSMCVNDYHGYGQHTGRLHAARFDKQRMEDELYLACTGREIICRQVNDHTVQVGRRKFPVLSYQTFVGNMMWDAARVTPETANRIADVLRKSGQYEPESGATAMWDRWVEGKPLFAALAP